MDGLCLKGSNPSRVEFFKLVCAFHAVTMCDQKILNQHSKLDSISIENGYSVTTVDYLAIVDYSAIVDYPQIATAKMKGNVPQCGLIMYNVTSRCFRLAR